MTEYDIETQVMFGPLQRVDVGALADGCDRAWWNRSLLHVNESVLRLGVFEGEFHWHKHDREDEIFLVLDGELLVDVEGEPTIALAPRQALLVPKGVVHRTRAPRRTVVLMIEAATIRPTGD